MQAGPASRYNIAFLLALALVAALWLQGRQTQAALEQSNAEVMHALRLLSASQELLSSLQDVETGIRGYVIVGDPVYLRPYQQGHAALPDKRAQLARLLPPGIRDGDWMRELDAAMAVRTATAESIVAAMQRGEPERAAVLVRGGDGMRAMERIRGLVGDLQRRENAALEQRNAKVAAQADRMRTMQLLGGQAALVLLLAAMFSINRSLDARRRALERERAQRGFLRTVVDTDENPIFVRDGNGRITLCNLAFAALLERTPAQLEQAGGLDTAQAARLEPLLAGAPEPGGQWRADAVRLADAPGGERWFQVVKRALPAADSPGEVLAVAVDISERMRAQQLKDEFVSTVSHELRTPLTSIRGALDMVGAGMGGEVPAAAQSLVGIAQKNTDRLVRLINDILDIQKLEAGRLRMHPQRLALRPLLQQALEQNDGYARQFGVELALLAGADGEAEVDADRFAQIMANLLSNAIKHSPQGGRVEVALEARDDRLEVSVRDHGPGIPAEFRDRIFGRFAQADSGDSRSRGGTGLGLAITRALVQQMHGDIDFDSEPGAGATFRFRLPSAQPAARVAAHPAEPAQATGDAGFARNLAGTLERSGYTVRIAADRAQVRRALQAPDAGRVVLGLAAEGRRELDLLDEVREHARERQAGLPAMLFGLHAAAPSRRPRVLHVEDDADLRALLAARLADAVLDIVGAESLDAARQALRGGHYDLVVLDLMLPDGDGSALLPDLAGAAQSTPVIVFSALDARLQDNPGVVHHLVKSRHHADELANLIVSTLDHWTPARPADA